MSAPAQPAQPVGPNTLISIKILYDDNTRRFKVPLKDLGAHVLPQKLHQLLDVPSDVDVIFERFSDSAGYYIELDSDNVAVYKQLYRAAKAKLKLRLKATTVNKPLLPESPASPEITETATQHESPSRSTYLDTVITQSLPDTKTETSFDPNFALNASMDKLSFAADDDVASPQPRSRDFGRSSTGFPLAAHQSPTGLFCIDCNCCGGTIPNEHYHCSTCENGDYDLCLQCVWSGVSCPGESHWLIKRFVKDGIVTNSTTETLAPRAFKPLVIKEEEQMPGPEPKPEETAPEKPCAAEEGLKEPDERICNACLKDFDETKMVTCMHCDDYDLCMTCLLHDSHGHHPGHAFSLIHDRQFCLKGLVTSRCNPGRHYQHAAVCDGCEKRIIGVRHKCLACPDWDYCMECIPDAPSTHPGHRFTPIYGTITEPFQHQEVHYGIFCDGPLCKDKASSSYITGVRYKCAVCHDTDFCAKCEALPLQTHNHTHPLIKFKTPVRRVTVSTANEDAPNGQVITLGDRVQKSTSTQANAPSELAANTPARELSDEKAQKDNPEADEEAVKQQRVSVPNVRTTTAPVAPLPDPTAGYQAFFVRDAIPDGTALGPSQVFRQTWTLYNPGPLAWPAGSDVRFVAGDTMFNVDNSRPSSLQSVSSAMETNKLSAPLEPGQSAEFSVLLRSPSRTGSAISYWRLKLANGMPFGHRLWCAISVKEGDAPEPVQEEPEQPEQPTGEQEPARDEPELTQSRMIFPTLDKESPVASTHEETVAAAPRSEPSVTNHTEQDYLTITDTMSMDDDETRDGFLTDEEYDVLDASDQEYLETKQSQ